MRENFWKILKFVMKHWVEMLLTFIGVSVGGWLLWLYKEYLKDWLLSTRYVEMPGWLWVLIVIVISVVPAMLVFWIMRRESRILTDERDIKNALKEWYRKNVRRHDFGSGYRVTVDFPHLDRQLNLTPGSAELHIEEAVGEEGGKTRNKGLRTIEVICPSSARFNV
jgi:hypothetical protein